MRRRAVAGFYVFLQDQEWRRKIEEEVQMGSGVVTCTRDRVGFATWLGYKNMTANCVDIHTTQLHKPCLCS